MYLSQVPAKDLTITQCKELVANYYDRYLWETDDQIDLWCAGMAKYLVRMADLREVTDEHKTIYEVSHAVNNHGGPPYRKLAHIECTISRMVNQYMKNKPGMAALDTMVWVTGLGK